MTTLQPTEGRDTATPPYGWAVVVACLAMTLALALWGCGERPGEPIGSRVGPRSGQSPPIAARSAASVVHLDEAGRPIVPPPALVPPAEPAGVTAQAAPELQVEPAPGGGDMIVTRGRLRQSSIARLRPEGGLVSECARPREGGTRDAAD